jgi:hypothetical protein
VADVEDLTALLADHQAGKDIAPRLAEKRLDLAAFLHLMRSRDLAAARTIRQADWADVYAIAVQVAKLGRYPAWRAEEEARGLTLGPDHFVLPDPTTPLVDLPEWRATLQARRKWQATLLTRTRQRQDVIQALQAVVDAAEAEALPGLRDLLVATAGDAAQLFGMTFEVFSLGRDGLCSEIRETLDQIGHRPPPLVLLLDSVAGPPAAHRTSTGKVPSRSSRAARSGQLMRRYISIATAERS